MVKSTIRIKPKSDAVNDRIKKKNPFITPHLRKNGNFWSIIRGTRTRFSVSLRQQQTQTYPTLLISEEGENEVAKPSFLYEFDSTEEEGMVAHR